MGERCSILGEESVTKDGSGQARPPGVRLERATATERSVVAYHESQFLIPLSGA